jgi:hypothetical protein
VQAWKEDYPWLQQAFKNWGGDWKAASESWRARIEDELGATLDFKVREDGTATVWCGMSGHDFHHYPVPKELLEGLADCYRREVKRVGGGYPTQTRQWKMSEAVSAASPAPPDPRATVAVATRAGPVEISPAAREALLREISRRGSEDAVVRAFEQASLSQPVSLDRFGKIVVFDAVWTLAENAGGDDLIDPQLRLLRDRFREEIAQGPAA